MTTPWFVSSDSHLIEPPDLFTTRLDRAYRDRAPIVENVVLDGGITFSAADAAAGGVDYWSWDGITIPIPVVCQARPGDRFLAERPDRRRYVDVPSTCYTPDGYLRDNEMDGVYSLVFNPSAVSVMYCLEDVGFMMACFRAYNDFALEFAAGSQDRMKPICLVTLDDVPAAIAEMERVMAVGAAGVHIPTEQTLGNEYDNPRYEPFWAAAAANNVPLHFHVGTSRLSLEQGLVKLLQGGIARFIGSADHHVRFSIMNMIYSGVFDRHPGLRVVSMENGAGWVPYFLREMDWHWKYNSLRESSPVAEFHDFPRPSDYFRRNVYVSFGFMEDDLILKLLHEVNVDRIMWASDYPHDEGSFPKSREIVRAMFDGIPTDVATKILQTNAAALYGLAVAAPAHV